jgi:Domain of unknown function (DUF397)
VTGFEEPRSAWRKSTASDSGACVEVAADPGSVLIRDSKDRGGAMLRLPSVAWSAFVEQGRGTDPGLGRA